MIGAAKIEGDGVRESLIKLLGDDLFEVKRGAVEALGFLARSGDKEAERSLGRILWRSDQDWHLRHEAAAGLAFSESAEAKSTLLRFICEGDHAYTRRSIPLLWARTRRSDIAEALKTLAVSGEEESVAKNAVIALHKLYRSAVIARSDLVSFLHTAPDWQQPPSVKAKATELATTVARVPDQIEKVPARQGQAEPLQPVQVPSTTEF